MIATSTDTEPESAKNTCSSPAGVISTSVRARSTAGACVSPPNITWLIGAELVADRGVEHGMAVAVHGRPPRRHAVDELTPVGEAQGHPFGGGDRQRRHEGGHRRVGVPHPLPVLAEQAFDIHGRRA